MFDILPVNRNLDVGSEDLDEKIRRWSRVFGDREFRLNSETNFAVWLEFDSHLNEKLAVIFVACRRQVELTDRVSMNHGGVPGRTPRVIRLTFVMLSVDSCIVSCPGCQKIHEGTRNHTKSRDHRPS